MFLTFLALQTETDSVANSVDPDETGHDEPSHLAEGGRVVQRCLVSYVTSASN